MVQPEFQPDNHPGPRQDRCGQQPPACWRKSIPSDPSRLREVRVGIEQFTRDAGFDDNTADEIALCVNEALANIMRHAYHGRHDRPIVIDAHCDRHGIRLSLRDWGDRLDPSLVRCHRYDPREPGGLGLVCLKRLMDEVNYQPQAQGTLLTMSRRKR